MEITFLIAEPSDLHNVVSQNYRSPFAGFKTVLQALTQYRLACSVGTISVAPTEAFKLEASKNWLFKQ